MHPYICDYAFSTNPFSIPTVILFRKHTKDLHQQGKVFKNLRRHQHDGGRAWIKDGQLHDAIRSVNPSLITRAPETQKD